MYFSYGSMSWFTYIEFHSTTWWSYKVRKYLVVRAISAFFFWVLLICHQPSPHYSVFPQGIRCPYLAFHLVIWGWERRNHLRDLHTNSMVRSHFSNYVFRGDFYTASQETVKAVIAFPANASDTYTKAIWKPDAISKHVHTLKCKMWTQSCTKLTHK